MKLVLISAALLLGLGFGREARAGIWTLGAGLGAEVLSQPQQTASVFSAPTGVLGTAILEPGIRYSNRSDDGRSAWLVDAGAILVSSESQTDYGVSFILGYLRTFHDGSSPYWTLGAGMLGLGESVPTFQILGGGLGYRHVIPHGHGAVRVELRDDILRPTESGPNLNRLSVRFGFDLDMK